MLEEANSQQREKPAMMLRNSLKDTAQGPPSQEQEQEFSTQRRRTHIKRQDSAETHSRGPMEAQRGDTSTPIAEVAGTDQ